MSSFTRANAMIKYDREASRLLKDEYYRNLQLFRYYIGKKDSNQWVDVPMGMLSDGASVPWPANILIPPWGSYSQAVLLHDHLCYTYEKTVLKNGVVTKVKIDRAEVDAILAEAMTVLQVEAWRAMLINAGVTLHRVFTKPTKPDRNPIRLKLEAEFDPNKFVMTA